MIRILCVLDGKPGHQNQVLGLRDAILRLAPGHAYAATFPSLSSFITQYRRGIDEVVTWASGDPWATRVIIGAGHKTHLPMLLLGKRFGAITTVLMRPSLPIRLFDFCVTPEGHSSDTPSSRILPTQGVLNRIQPSLQLDPHRGLILIGGPSKHFRWDDAAVLDQVTRIVAHTPDCEWAIGTSRRTPEALQHQLQSSFPSYFVPSHACPPDWIVKQLEASGTVWVTQDSVSMCYESATAGGQVGLIELPSMRINRVTRMISALVNSGRATPFSDWCQNQKLRPQVGRFAETDRVARILVSRILGPMDDDAVSG